MKKTCDYERYIDAQIDRDLSIKRVHEQEIKLQFHMNLEEWFYEAINDFIDKENEYTKEQRKIVGHIWKFMKNKIK